MVKQRKRVWVVVTDSASAHCLRWDDDSGSLESVPGGELRNATLGQRTQDIKSDKPGRSFASSGGGTRHAIEPHHDYRKMEKHRFTETVADFLAQARARDGFDRLILVAPRRSLGELRKVLAGGVRQAVWKEVPKDLTSRSAVELSTILGEDLRHAATGLAAQSV